MEIKLSIIILNYNTENLLEDCLNSIIKSGIKKDWEIIIIDNCSNYNCKFFLRKLINQLKKDEKVSNLQLVENHKNLGYSRANNIGIREAKGKYILLLNSDTLLSPNTLGKIIKFLDNNQKVAVATCRVEMVDGRLDPACHRGFPTPWNSFCYFSGLEKLFPHSKIFSGYHLGFLPMDKIHEIDSPSGAFYLVRKSVVGKVGLLDEDYFMYGEDLDWSYRIKKTGDKIVYFPEVKIIHLKKRSGRMAQDKILRKEINNYFYQSMKLFYQKHYQKKYPQILLWLIFLTIDLKKILSDLLFNLKK